MKWYAQLFIPFIELKFKIFFYQTHRLCLPLPLYHGFACAGVITGGVHGACVVFPGPTYNGQETVNAIQNEK